MNKLLDYEVLNWFGDDEKEDIAKYIASNLNSIANGSMTVEELILMIKEHSNE